MSLYIAGVPIYTNLSEYIEPVKCSVEFWDLKKLEERYSYDSFAMPSSGAVVTGCSVSPPGINSAGSFEILIDDSEASFDFNMTRRANIVVIKAKKFASQDYQNLLYGQTKSVQAIRGGGNSLQFKFSGVGSGALLDDRIVNIQKVANPASNTLPSPDPFISDVNMQINNLFKDMLENPASYAVDDVTLQEQLNMSDDTIDLLDASIVKSKILAINQKYVSASALLQSMLESVGADGGINSYNQPYLKWPNTGLSGIVIKSWDDAIAGAGLELADRTSYFVDPFTWTISWNKSDGFINRYISQAESSIVIGGNASEPVLPTEGSITQGEGNSNFNTNGFVSLTLKDYALQIDPKQTRIQNLAVVIEKKGDGTADTENIKTVHGHIIEDINDSPIGSTVAIWDIPLANVPQNMPTAMFLQNIVYTGSKTINSDKKYWITIYNRGRTEDDTINWYTVPTPQDMTSNIASRNIAKGYPWAADHNIVNGWEIELESPNMLAFSIFDNYKHDIIAEDIESQEIYGVVEDVVQTPFAQSPLAAQRYLDALLQYSALPKMITDPGNITIPNNLIMPGILVNIEDAHSGIIPAQNFQAEVSDLQYEFGTANDQSLGALYVKVSPVGFYNWRLDSDGF